jgi:aerobic-type carbon monoxide dehydrogenase small subunit (CoxS/CutS family)
MSAITLNVNGITHRLDIDPTTPLLYALSEDLQLRGPKFGCGLSQCGACTAIFNGDAVRTCVTPVSRANGATISTLDGLGTAENPHPIQKAFIDEQAVQCGFCLSLMKLGLTWLGRLVEKRLRGQDDTVRLADRRLRGLGRRISDGPGSPRFRWTEPHWFLGQAPVRQPSTQWVRTPQRSLRTRPFSPFGKMPTRTYRSIGTRGLSTRRCATITNGNNRYQYRDVLSPVQYGGTPM